MRVASNINTFGSKASWLRGVKEEWTEVDIIKFAVLEENRPPAKDVDPSVRAKLFPWPCKAHLRCHTLDGGCVGGRGIGVVGALEECISKALMYFRVSSLFIKVCC